MEDNTKYSKSEDVAFSFAKELMSVHSKLGSSITLSELVSKTVEILKPSANYSKRVKLAAIRAHSIYSSNHQAKEE